MCAKNGVGMEENIAARCDINQIDTFRRVAYLFVGACRRTTLSHHVCFGSCRSEINFDTYSHY